METKWGEICFRMKDKIIELSILGLQKDGLRFSVDTIAKQLKISKKTIYKFFPSKEELSVAVYQKFYNDADEQIEKIFLSDDDKFLPLLSLYYQSFCMVKKEIFNKYSLNETIKQLAIKKHNSIKKQLQRLFLIDEKEIITTIIDGTFEKLNGEQLTPQIAKKLEHLI